MTLLQMCQRLREKTNYANAGPTTVVGASGDHARAINWVIEAFVELQNRCDWRWLRKGFTIETTVGIDEYGASSATDVPTTMPISRLKSWCIKDRWNPPKCYLVSSGKGTEYPLTFIPWESFQYLYRLGSQTSGAPTHISIDPADNIVLGPMPDGAYVVTGEYNRSAQVLAANDDIPEMPSQYHMVIVYMAMGSYGLFEPADEAINESRVNGRKLLRQLEATQSPRMRKAGPMA